MIERLQDYKVKLLINGEERQTFIRLARNPTVARRDAIADARVLLRPVRTVEVFSVEVARYKPAA